MLFTQWNQFNPFKTTGKWVLIFELCRLRLRSVHDQMHLVLSLGLRSSSLDIKMRPHRRQPTKLPHPWDSPGKNTGVGCHFLLQCMKGKSESEVAQSCPTLSNPMDYSLPGSSIHGIFQARVLEWGAIAFSLKHCSADPQTKTKGKVYFKLTLLGDCGSGL